MTLAAEPYCKLYSICYPVALAEVENFPGWRFGHFLFILDMVSDKFTWIHVIQGIFSETFQRFSKNYFSTHAPPYQCLYFSHCLLHRIFCQVMCERSKGPKNWKLDKTKHSVWSNLGLTNLKLRLILLYTWSLPSYSPVPYPGNVSLRVYPPLHVS